MGFVNATNGLVIGGMACACGGYLTVALALKYALASVDGANVLEF